MLRVMASPTSQKARAISFVQLSGAGWSGARHDLIIRPEELTRQEPFRTTVHQTLGGGYVDAFGRGVGMVSLSGTTGWRGGPDEDGAAKFDALRDAILAWSSAREKRVSAGLSPDKVELGLIDTLDGFELSVAPLEFMLRRSKQRPLLRQFQIRLAVVRDLSDPPAGDLDSILSAISSPLGRVGSALESLEAAAEGQGRLASALSGARGVLGPLATAGSGFLEKSRGLLETVRGGVDAVTGAVDSTLKPVFDLTRDVQQAGRNIFQAIDAVAGIPNHVIYQINAIAGNLQGAYCDLINGFDRLQTAFDLDPLFGASNCSSTGGGRPISQWGERSPFETLTPTTTPAPVTADARSVIQSSKALDPVAQPLTITQASDRLDRIASGVSA